MNNGFTFTKLNKFSLWNFFKQLKLNSNDYKNLRLSIFPLILAQILQRLYFVVDNHFIAKLGSEALLINNIQFSFLYIGQYIGGATATSCLIFWNRQEYKGKQGSVFFIHILLCVLASALCMTIGYIFSHRILNYFSVPSEYTELATNYFKCGLMNLILQSLYVSLLGVMVALGKERLTFIISGGMLITATIINYFSIHLFFNGIVSPETISKAMYVIIFSNSILLFLASACMFFSANQNKLFQKLSNMKEIGKVWGNEIGGGFLTSIDPIIYVFQLGLVITASSLLVTYQLLMQLAAIFCILLIATMQVCIRDASKTFSSNSFFSFTVSSFLS